MAQTKTPTGFLSLPKELRDLVYQDVLTSVFPFIPHCRRPATRTMFTPAILRTCKQIHSEGCAFLYSKNTFCLSEATQDLAGLNTISEDSLRCLKNLQLFPYRYRDKSVFETERQSWYRLLRVLAGEATGLRQLYVSWDALGNDLNFFNHLTGIQNLQILTVSGFHGASWPSLLADKMNVHVQVEYSRGFFERMIEDIPPSDGEAVPYHHTERRTFPYL